MPELTEYTYNHANEILTAGDSSFAFDGNGNQTRENDPAEGPTTFAYDFENRLTTLDPRGADNLEFAYSGTGDRLKTTENGTEKRYLLDLNKPLTDILADADATNAKEQYYLYGINLVARVNASGDIFYYHPDHLGSIMAVTDTANAITAAFAYDEFGAVAGEMGSEPGPWRFCGAIGLVQPVTGSLTVRARLLQPAIGRFTARDVLRRAANTQDVNRFAYVRNNPLSLLDPSGWEPVSHSPTTGLGTPVDSMTTWEFADKMVGYEMELIDKGLSLFSHSRGWAWLASGRDITQSLRPYVDASNAQAFLGDALFALSTAEFATKSFIWSSELLLSSFGVGEAPTIEETLEVLDSTPFVGFAFKGLREALQDPYFRTGFTLGTNLLFEDVSFSQTKPSLGGGGSW